MTSDDIRKEITSGGSDNGETYDIAYYLKEIALQLAVMNERNAYKDAEPVEYAKATFGLPPYQNIESGPGSACVHAPLGPEECRACRHKRILS
jgi:hypothetical protein